MTTEQKSKIISLRNAGYGYAAVAKEIGIICQIEPIVTCWFKRHEDVRELILFGQAVCSGKFHRGNTNCNSLHTPID